MGRLMSWSFWFRRIVEITVALLLAFVVIQLSASVNDRQRGLLPASTWFVVNEIYVPDHGSGSNPLMIYDRVIRENFRGFWVVEVQSVNPNGLFQNVCSGFGTNDYDTSEIIVDDKVRWVWFVGRECAVPAGDYRLRVSYTLKKPGWPEKEVWAVSNVFTVS